MTLSHIAMALGFVLILVGLYGALSNRDIFRMIVSFTIADTGVNVVLVSVGYLPGRTAPILDAAVPTSEALARITDPVPQALVLTAIVIGFGVLAFAVVLIRRAYEVVEADDMHQMRDTDT